MPIIPNLESRNDTFYVVFEKCDYQKWWHSLFVRNEWKHCWVFKEHVSESLGKSHTLAINPIRSNINFHYWEVDPAKLAYLYMKQEAVLDIVRISRHFYPYSPYVFYGMYSCVAVIKAIMGIDKLFVSTPKGLHEHLLRIGGLSLKENKNGWSDRPDIRGSDGEAHATAPGNGPERNGKGSSISTGTNH